MEKYFKKSCIIATAVASALTTSQVTASILQPNSIYQMTLDPGSSFFALDLDPAIGGLYTMQDHTIINPLYINPLSPQGNGVIDGHAGVIEFQTDTTGDLISVTSFQIDPIQNTFGGYWYQYADSTAAMSGEFTSFDAMELQLTGRKALMSDFVTSLGETPFMRDVSTGLYEKFTTGTACNLEGCVTGSAVAESLTTPGEFTATLVSAGKFSSDWTYEDMSQYNLTNQPYFEVWTSQNTITYIGPASTVPIPAAAWLFVSGLLGLAGVARRKRKSLTIPS